MDRRLKVLVVAAAAHPEKGSEPGLGWAWIEALSKYHDLWIITGEKEGNREAAERRFAVVPDLRERLKVHYIPRPDGPPVERLIPLFYYRRYRKWHEKAFELASGLDNKVHFDIAHQLNMTGYREPGFLWKLNLPFVWGPVGGTANVPLRFGKILGAREFLYHLAKVTTNNLQLRFQPRVKKALARADGFVTSTSDTRAVFLSVHDKDSVVIPDTGPPVDSCPNLRPPYGPRDVLRLSWSGIHVSRKALPLVLHALARLPESVSWHLDIIGEGPMTIQWKDLARKLRIESHCSWHGWLKKNEANSLVAQSHIFVFPSLHEGMPTVVMEALSMGIPVICLDHCGQADAVTEKCGVKIPVTKPQLVIKNLSDVILWLAAEPQKVDSLSRGARERIWEFSWDKKAKAMLDVYEAALASFQSRK